MTPAVERQGKQIVNAQCAQCHMTGMSGAPKIGDQAAWTPRLRQGIDYAVRSAIHGRGAMPARGGMADLTDSELRAAIAYMSNPGGGAPEARP
jgi:cytochrome c5